MNMKLEYPIKTGSGEKISELNLRRPTAQDLLIATKAATDGGLELVAVLAANLAERAPEDIDELDCSDFYAVVGTVGDLLKYSSDAISTTADGGKQIKLAHPLGSIAEITLRRPKAREVIKYSKVGDADGTVDSISALSGIKRDQLLALDAADFKAIEEAMADFFPSQPRASARASSFSPAPPAGALVN